MRIGFLSLALIIPVFAGASGGSASAEPVTFVQTQQPRDQRQSQQGLPPDKKRAISQFGPDEIFGPQLEDNNRDRRSNPPRVRNQPTPAPTPSFRPRTPAPSTPPPSPDPPQPREATPEPTTEAAATLDSRNQQPPLGQENSPIADFSKWIPFTLIGLAVIVSLLLIYTLSKLVEKIREGSGG